MASTDKPRWLAYKQMLDSVQNNTEEAYTVADALLEDIKKAPVEKKRKRRGEDGRELSVPSFAVINLPPLEGCRTETSDNIRKVVALRFSGYTDSEICRQLDKNKCWINILEVRHPKAFQLAEAELLKNCKMAYERNVTICRAALSDIGMAAVKTLGKVMEDTEAKPRERLRAAETVLKLMIGTTPNEKSVAQGVVINMGDVAQKYEQHMRQSQSYIHNIEDAEVVGEEDEGVIQSRLCP